MYLHVYLHVRMCMCAESTRSSSIIIGRLVVGDSRNGATVLHSLSTHTTHTRRIYSILIEFQFSISPFNWIQWKSVDETVFSALCASLTHSCPAVLALSPSSLLGCHSVDVLVVVIAVYSAVAAAGTPSPREPRLPALMAPTMPH